MSSAVDEREERKKRRKIFYVLRAFMYPFALVSSFGENIPIPALEQNTCGIEFNVLQCLSKRFGFWWGLNGKTIYGIGIGHRLTRRHVDTSLFNISVLIRGLKIAWQQIGYQLYYELTLVENMLFMCRQCIGIDWMNWCCNYGVDNGYFLMI